MAEGHLQKTKPGEPFRPRASDWNAFVDAADFARRALELEREAGSLAAYFWRFEPAAAERPQRLDHATLKGLAHTAASHRLSADLRRRGWSFVGPTTAYAFMQAMGLVNDHLEGCWCREEVARARRAFRPPLAARDAIA